MKLVTAAQMREIDRITIEEMFISGETLMKNAAGHIATVVMEHTPPGGNVAVFCGTGNNGGDGIGAAVNLLKAGVSVRVFLIGETGDLSPDSKIMYNSLSALGGSLEHITLSSDHSEYVNNCAVVVDAIFGIGLNSELREDALTAVSMINSSRAFIISADVPSGVHADTGSILGDAVKADMTVTFSFAKPGHFVEPGCIYCGKLRVCDIGVPRELLNSITSYMYAAMPGDISLPHRRLDTHKGSYGRLLIVAGSVGYTGAPSLSARAASKTGAGLVFLGVPKSIYEIMASKLEEEMPFPLPDDNEGRLSAKSASEILRRASQCNVCLIGPGLGNSRDITELVQSLTRISETPMILDADGLNAIAENIDILNQAVCPLILTPHPGEFARLGGDMASGDRLGASRDFATKYGCILVLKGHRTIVALPNGTAYINTTGGPAMAKGGTGDVLAGMIAALIAQKFPIVHAVAAAVYIHGLAGDMCAEEYGEYSVTAGNIVDKLPEAIKTVVK